MSDSIQNPDIDILGQKFLLPDGGYKLLSLVALLAFIVGVIWILTARRYAVTKNRDGFSFSVVDNKAIIVEGYTIGFWTPSDDTKNTIRTKDDSLKHMWQIVQSFGANFEEANQEFGKRLSKKFDFGGYRRYKVIGMGESGNFKEGWWWNISFQGKCDDEFLKELKDLYYDFWSENKSEKWDKLYIEIVGRRD
jgi:hypothetical protein